MDLRGKEIRRENDLRILTCQVETCGSNPVNDGCYRLVAKGDKPR